MANVALSANGNINMQLQLQLQLQLAFSGTKLTNPTRAQDLLSEAEQQHLHISGRQCLVEARCRS